MNRLILPRLENFLSEDVDDARLMAAALRLARRGLGLARPNPSVGCLIVRPTSDGPVIIGRGVTSNGGRPHAEANALAEAGKGACGASAYVTLEPCSHLGRAAPCSEALIKAGIARVVCALEDPDPRIAGRGFAKLSAAGIIIRRDVLRDEAMALHRGHLARIRFGRPHVTLKLALSRDGKLGLSGQRITITNEASNRYVHRLRAQSDAIAIGITTALSDDPLLNVRLPGLKHRSPARVVFDSDLRLPLNARLLRDATSNPVHILAKLDVDPDRQKRLIDKGATIHLLPTPWLAGRGVQLEIALRELGKIGITSLLLEGGLQLAKAFFARDLVDEVILLTGQGMIGKGGIAGRDPGPLDDVLVTPHFDHIATDFFDGDSALYYQRRR